MNLKIRGEKLEITNAMKEYASNKINKLSKYLEQQEQIQSNILFKKQGVKQKVEITIPLKKYTLRVEETGEDFYATIDTAIDKLERQIIKNKTRINSKENIKSSVIIMPKRVVPYCFQIASGSILFCSSRGTSL